MVVLILKRSKLGVIMAHEMLTGQHSEQFCRLASPLARKTTHCILLHFVLMQKLGGTFSQLLECNLLLLFFMILVFLWQEILLFCHCGELCAFTLALLLPLFGQRLRQKPEWDTGQQDQGASCYEAQPPGTHPA